MSNAIQGQSFLDLLLEASGSINNAIFEAKNNGKRITDEIEIGFNFSANQVVNKQIAASFAVKRPATGSPLIVDEQLDFYALPSILPLILS